MLLHAASKVRLLSSLGVWPPPHCLELRPCLALRLRRALHCPSNPGIGSGRPARERHTDSAPGHRRGPSGQAPSGERNHRRGFGLLRQLQNLRFRRKLQALRRRHRIRSPHLGSPAGFTRRLGCRNPAHGSVEPAEGDGHLGKHSHRRPKDRARHRDRSPRDSLAMEGRKGHQTLHDGEGRRARFCAKAAFKQDHV